MSLRLHGTFTAIPSQPTSGTLTLVRRCESVSCLGHCTCAPHGQMTCPATGSCTNVTGGFCSSDRGVDVSSGQ